MALGFQPPQLPSAQATPNTFEALLTQAQNHMDVHCLRQMDYRGVLTWLSGVRQVQELKFANFAIPSGPL